MSNATEPGVELLAQVWRSIDELCAGLAADEWDRPTDCPGWSVRDQLSHLVGGESMMLGRPWPEHTAPGGEHLRNPMGETNEIEVDYRRSRPGPVVLGEFRELTAERLVALRAMGEADFAADSWTPTGPGSYRDLLAIRVFDAWVHEQDIRRAVGKPGDLAGPVAEHALGRCLLAMPFVVGKKAGAPDGATVVFDVTGPTSARRAVGVQDGRARALDAVPDQPAATVTADVETFTMLGCGRLEPAAALADGRARVAGDEQLGRRVVEQMAFMI